jgi:hypothetical protein
MANSSLHESDDLLELYALDRLSEPDVARVEEHLLACGACNERLDRVASFAFSVREVLHDNPAGAERIEPLWGIWASRFRAWWALPSWGWRMAWGGVLICLLGAGMVLFRGSNPVLPTATLQLTAVRGGLETAPPALEYDLTLRDLPASPATLNVGVVDESGAPVWTGSTEGGLVKVRRPLTSGVYFIRVFAADGSLLHEYGLRIKERE